MACSKYASTRQTTHAARMSRLLFGPCTDLLRDVLRQNIPETSFPATLQNRRVKGILLGLRNLQASQRTLLYPQGGTFSGSYNDFDISLLYLLLRNITNITPHSNGWGSPPDPNDRSVSANIDRIRIIRNQIGAHCHRPDLSDADFSSSWAELKLSIVEIVRSTGISTNYEQFVNDLANETMDPDREDYWLDRLQKQIQDDTEKYQEVVKNVDNIREKIEGISTRQEKQGEVQRKQISTLMEHENLIRNQGDTQANHGATLARQENLIREQVNVQTKHGATLARQENLIREQADIQTKHGVTLARQENLIREQGNIQAKQETALARQEEIIGEQGHVQVEHGAALARQEEIIRKQGQVQAEHGTALARQEEIIREQSCVQAKHETALARQEEIIREQGHVQAEHGTALARQEEIIREQGQVQAEHGTALARQEEIIREQSRVQAKHETALARQEEIIREQGQVQTQMWTTMNIHQSLITEQRTLQAIQDADLQLLKEAQDKEAKNILDSTKVDLQKHKSSNTYIRTAQVDVVIRKLLEQNIVILTGRPGDGKSTIARQVLCDFSSDVGYVPVIITKPRQWDKIVNPYEKIIVFIDDIFGSSNVDNGAVEKWKNILESRISSANKGNILVLISSRSTIIAEVRKSCEQNVFSPEYEIDLASNVLTEKEKENMLLQYEKVHVYRTSDLIGDKFREYEKWHGKDAVYKLSKGGKYRIVKSEPYYGFPQTCFLFFARKEFFQLGTDFFLRPNKVFFQNIDNMRKSTAVGTKMQYCTLAYVFLEEKINIRGLKEDIFQDICEKSSLPKWTEVDVEDAVQDLEGIYLSPSNQRYVFTFCHVTIREAVAVSFGKLAPDIVTQKCSDEILYELIRTEGYEARDGEVILTIRKKYYPLLANRLLSERPTYVINHPAVRHPATDDAEFTSVLFDEINKSPHSSCRIIKQIWNDLKYLHKPILYGEILTRHGPHHIKHKAEYDNDVSVDKHDTDTPVERPYLIPCEEVKERLDDHLYSGNKQSIIVIIRYVISNCDVNYFLNSYNDILCDLRGMSVLHCCVARGWTDVVDELLNVVTPTKTENNWSCLHFASFFRRFELCKKFEKLSSNVLETTREGYNILQVILLGLRYGMYKSNFVSGCSLSMHFLLRITVYYLSVSDTYDSRVCFHNISEHETDFVNILQHVMTGYPSLITSIDMPLDQYNNNIIHYLLIHDRQEIYDMLVNKKKDLIFCRNNSKLPTTLHVAAYLGRVEFVEKLWKAGIRAIETDISIAKSVESGKVYSSKTLKLWSDGWKDQGRNKIDNIKLKCIRYQSVRFGSSDDYDVITSICSSVI